MARFSAKLMEHFNAPKNGGGMPDADAIGQANHQGAAPRCEIYLRFRDGLVSRAAFTTYGCGVAIACCSALTELVAGRTIESCLSIEAEEVVRALEGVPPDKAYCASVAIAALRDALQNHDADR